RAEEDPDEAVHQVHRAQRDAEAQNQIGKELAEGFHDSVPPEQLIGQSDAVDEYGHGADDERDGDENELHRSELVPGQRSDDDERDQRGYEPDPCEEEAEGYHAEAQHYERPEYPTPDLVAALEVSPGADAQPECHHDVAEIGREITRSHPHCATHGVIAGHPDRRCAEDDEHHPGPEVGVVGDLAFNHFGRLLLPYSND